MERLKGPFLVTSHQPLADLGNIDNPSEVQALLYSEADKVLLAVNGHIRINHLAKAGVLSYLHLNSASYKWVGESYRNRSNPAEVHSKFRWIEYACPYRESIFATLTLDPANARIEVRGRKSQWIA